MADTTRYADRPLAAGTVQIDTERVKVTEWRFPPRGHTGWHRHEFDYVIVPISTGELLIDNGSELHTGQMISGQSYNRDKGAEHDVINDNDREFVFIEIELKP